MGLWGSPFNGTLGMRGRPIYGTLCMLRKNRHKCPKILCNIHKRKIRRPMVRNRADQIFSFWA